MRIAFFFLLSLSLFSRPVKADAYRPFDDDKIGHLGISYSTTMLLNGFYQKTTDWNLTQRILLSALPVFAAGLAKELVDSEFSTGDLIADGIGVGLAVGTSFVIEW